MHLLSLLCL